MKTKGQYTKIALEDTRESREDYMEQMKYPAHDDRLSGKISPGYTALLMAMNNVSGW